MRRWCWVIFFSIPFSTSAKVSHFELAEAWAPIIYKDVSAAFVQTETGFSPVDHLVGLFFDENEDLRDNGINIFRISNEYAKSLLEKAPVYYSVIETRTHWYLNYILYHAIDLNIFSHTHDTENIWMVIRKSSDKKFGDLEFFVTNSHGYPKIYGDTNQAMIANMNFKKRFLQQFLPAIDQYSEDHHFAPGVEYVTDKKSTKRFRLFVAAKTHAIYKFDSEAWRNKRGSGAVYLPESCRQLCDSEGQFEENPANKVFYELKSWDEIYFKYSRSDLPVFTAKKNLFLPAPTNDVLPSYLIQGWRETEARALVFSAVRFKTKHSLADPAALHRHWIGEYADICRRYLDNPYLPPPKKEPKSLLSWFGFGSIE